MRNYRSNNLSVTGFRPSRWVSGRKSPHFLTVLLAVSLFTLLALVGGCSEDDCVNCVELPLPVVPTGVHSISGDGEIIVQWYDISYAPYDGSYNPNVETYYIYSRFFEFGDEDDPNREFFLIGQV